MPQLDKIIILNIIYWVFTSYFFLYFDLLTTYFYKVFSLLKFKYKRLYAIYSELCSHFFWALFTQFILLSPRIRFVVLMTGQNPPEPEDFWKNFKEAMQEFYAMYNAWSDRNDKRFLEFVTKFYSKFIDYLYSWPLQQWTFSLITLVALYWITGYIYNSWWVEEGKGYYPLSGKIRIIMIVVDLLINVIVSVLVLMYYPADSSLAILLKKCPIALSPFFFLIELVFVVFYLYRTEYMKERLGIVTGFIVMIFFMIGKLSTWMGRTTITFGARYILTPRVMAALKRFVKYDPYTHDIIIGSVILFWNYLLDIILYVLPCLWFHDNFIPMAADYLGLRVETLEDVTSDVFAVHGIFIDIFAAFFSLAGPSHGEDELRQAEWYLFYGMNTIFSGLSTGWYLYCRFRRYHKAFSLTWDTLHWIKLIVWREPILAMRLYIYIVAVITGYWGIL